MQESAVVGASSRTVPESKYFAYYIITYALAVFSKDVSVAKWRGESSGAIRLYLTSKTKELLRKKLNVLFIQFRV